MSVVAALITIFTATESMLGVKIAELIPYFVTLAIITAYLVIRALLIRGGLFGFKIHFKIIK